MDRTWERTQAFAEAVKTVGNDKGVPVVDCWSYIWEAADKDEIKLEGFFTDGLHLNEEGYAVSRVGCSCHRKAVT
jgi:lysophospholipase L1-like esterase